MMGHAVCTWLMLACCAVLVATESQDHVLRFVSQKELAQKNKEKGDDIIIVSGDKTKDLPMQKVDASVVKSNPVVCPGGWRECPANNTCCKMMSGEIGCCPRPNGVCCGDGIHCCPHGYTCDDAKKGCRPPQGEVFTPWEEKKPATPRPVKSVVCPGGQYECPDGNTCCELASGGWGCCPRPNAECCPDKIHCCPQSYKCVMPQGTCKPSQGGLYIPWEEKKPAKPRVSTGAVVCPDHKTQCADGQTCCQESGGEYGCCPFPEAVCCKDHTHCCPNGFSCNLKEKTCEKGQESVSWLPKQPPALRAPANIVCPDGQSQCPDGQTCCKNDAGAYACCPSPNATCCSDHVHCCPQGYKCDLAAKTCDHGLSQHFPSVPMLKKEPAVVEVNKVCPDGKSECADGQTCCKLSSGQYGCCPRPNAVCCADHLHCCPQGYTCDTGEGRCNKGLHSLPWDEKQPASLH